MRARVLAGLAAGVAAAGLAGPAAAEAPVVPLPEEARRALAPLGEGVVGAALPAAPIDEPARLRHLEPGIWIYQLVLGEHEGHEQVVQVERVAPGDDGAGWQVVTDGDEVQRLKVTSDERILKLSQSDARTDRLVVYRPGLVLETGMQVGQSQSVETRLATYKAGRPDREEYSGELDYTITYLGAYRVTTPAGRFDARLLEHRYVMKIGPATARYESYGFYADDVGNVAEVSEESVSALLVYRRSSRSGRVLLAAPEP